MEIEVAYKVKVSDRIIGCLMQDSDHPDRESVMEYLK